MLHERTVALTLECLAVRVEIRFTRKFDGLQRQTVKGNSAAVVYAASTET